MGAIRAGTSMGSAASTAYRLGQETSGSTSVGAGLGGVARAGAAAARQRVGEAAGIGEAVERGQRAALFAGATRTGGAGAGSGSGGGSDEAPQWAQRLRSEQNARHQRHAALQTIREGDRGGAGATPDIDERED
jgi:type IV secretion system protein TrbL